jgi:hypothetical protein
MPKIKYITAKEGHLYSVPGGKMKFICCDCGLVHDIEFETDGDIIYFRLNRNQGDTDDIRKTKKFKKKMPLLSQ